VGIFEVAWKRLSDITKDEIAYAEKEFKQKGRFLVDENVLIDIAYYLRQAGWKAQHVTEVGLSGQPDEAIFAYAFRHSLMLITHDPHFLDNRRFPLHRNPGIIVMLGGSGDIVKIAKALNDMLEIIAPYGKLYRGAKIEMHGEGLLTISMHHADSGKVESHRYLLHKHGMPSMWVNE
jgi:predicted nuclease of predicted toxin-antitoxin system